MAKKSKPVEKTKNEFKGEQTDIKVIPFTSDYIHEWKPKGVENLTIKMRPQNKGEKKKIREIGRKILYALSKEEDYLEFSDQIWDIVGGTFIDWQCTDENDKNIPFTMDAYEGLPDWLKMMATDESKEISGLGSKDRRFLES